MSLIPITPPSSQMATTQALITALHDTIAGVTEVPANKVRPLWQETDAPIPTQKESVIYFGITDNNTLGEVVVQQEDTSLKQTRTEELEVQMMFYGSTAEDLVCKFKEALEFFPNRRLLHDVGCAVVGTGSLHRNPERIKDRWYNRIDIKLILRRILTTVYENQLPIGVVNGEIRSSTVDVNDFEVDEDFRNK